MIAVVPARAGSERLPDKNFTPFCGTTLTDWAVEQAIRAGLDTYVSTDHPTWRPAGEKARIITRPGVLAGNSISSWDVLEHAGYHLGYFGAFLLLQPTSPLRSMEDIMACIELFNSKQQPVTSVHKGHANGAVYIRRWKRWDDEGIRYSMPWVRSCDIDVGADMEAAANIMGLQYLGKAENVTPFMLR